MNLEEKESGSEEMEAGGSEAKQPQSPRNTNPLNLRRLSLEIASTLGGTTSNLGKLIEDGEERRGSTRDAYLIDSAVRRLSSKVQLPPEGDEEEDAEDEGKVAEDYNKYNYYYNYDYHSMLSLPR